MAYQIDEWLDGGRTDTMADALGLDLASLAPALSADNPKRNMAASAVANVAMSTAPDVVCAVASGRRRLH